MAARQPGTGRATPVNLLLSGPSGGAGGRRGSPPSPRGRTSSPSTWVATSYDIAIIKDGRRSIIAQGDVDTLPVRVPMVEMRTIGAGGGSIVWLDEGGRLQVGPKSAGAGPPGLLPRGGIEPTVTDINVILGRLDPARFMVANWSLISKARARLSTGALPCRSGFRSMRRQPACSPSSRPAGGCDQAVAVRARARSARFHADVVRRCRRAACDRGRPRSWA